MVECALAGCFPPHLGCCLLVHLLRQPAKGEEPNAAGARPGPVVAAVRGAQGVRVRRIHPHLPDAPVLAGFPAEYRLKTQPALRRVAQGGAGQRCGTHFYGGWRQYRQVYFAPFKQDRQPDALGACEHIPQQGAAGCAERDPVSVRGVHGLPGPHHRVELSKPPFVFGVYFVAQHRPAYG